MPRQALFLPGLIVAAAAILVSPPLAANELMWRPTSPSFGGDPLNGGFLLNSAQIQNLHRPRASTAQPSEQERFLQSVRDRVYSRLSAQVADQIFGENPQERGTIDLGGQSVGYERVGGQIVLTLNDGGKTTRLSFPVAAAAP